MGRKRSRTASCVIAHPAKKPRTFESVRGHPRIADNPPLVWLDLLPPEVSLVIAASVAGGKQCIDALHLAQTSPLQCNAVASALSHNYSLHRRHRREEERPLAWMPVFMRSVRQLYVTRRFAKLSSKERSSALLLLSAPTLRIARVPDDPRVLRAVAKAPRLRELSVTLHEDGPWSMDATRLLLRSLAALRLHKLELFCCVSWESECPLRRIEQLADGRHALARCCPNLSSFRVTCSAHSDDPGGTIWSTLPHLREVTITRFPLHCVIPRLRKVQYVRIMDNNNEGVQLARRLGSSVTYIRVTEYPTVEGEITDLSECVRMSEMELLLDQGSERALVKTVCAMTDLKSLTLTWKLQCNCFRWHVFEFLNPSDAGGLPRIHLPRYREAREGVMLRVVQQAPALTRLDLLQVRLRVTEIVAILKHIGDRLKHFGVSFSGQHESSFERFTVFVETVIEHNRGLSSVSAGKERMPDMLQIDRIYDEHALTEEQMVQLQIRKNKLGTLLRRLRKCVPSLGEKSLTSWIEAVMWIDGQEL